jgi:hypothetical protein
LSRAKIEDAFPRLRRARYGLTSQQSNEYNCIAWAAEDTQRLWWPEPPAPFAYWPPGVDRKLDLGAFTAAFATLGYEPCDDGNLERGFEKIALFADAEGRPTHAARQMPTGMWSSKLGPWEDISHTIYGLEHAQYGDVVQYLRRKTPPPPPAEGG